MGIQPIGALAVLCVSMVCFALCCQGRSVIFSLAEGELHSLSRGQGLPQIKELLRHPKRICCALWLGQRLSLLGMVMAGWWGWQLLGRDGFVVPLLGLSFLAVVARALGGPRLVGDPSSLRRRPVAWGIWVLDRLLGPVGSILTEAGRTIGGILLRMPRGPEGGFLEKEVLGLVERVWHEGALEKKEHEMIHRMMEFGGRRVSTVMTPRSDMFCLPVHTEISEAMRLVRRAGYSRIPIYKERKDDVVGILLAKDLLKVKFPDSQGVPGSLWEMLRPAYFVPLHMEVGALFRELKRRKLHMALCVDEWGGVAGLVTMEDLLEELFGEIYDEHDLEVRRWESVGDGAYVVSGKLGLHELESLMHLEIREQECNTVAGLVLKKLGHFPSQGEAVEVGGIRFQVEKVGATRILALRVYRVTTPGVE